MSSGIERVAEERDEALADLAEANALLEDLLGSLNASRKENAAYLLKIRELEEREEKLEVPAG